MEARARGVRLVALVAGACGLLALAVPAGATAAPTGSIAGTVTGSDTHAAVQGVEVCGYHFVETVDEEGEFEVACTTTGPTGAYTIEELAAAKPVGLVAPGSVGGLDAHLVYTNPPPPLSMPSPTPTAGASPKKAKRPHCRKGFRLNQAKGKRRCVKVHRRHHHHRRHKHPHRHPHRTA